jgi:hypothetical protein
MATTGNTFGDRGLQHPDAGPSNIVVVTTPCGIESTVAACESTVCFLRNDWIWLVMLAIGVILKVKWCLSKILCVLI